MTLSSTKLVGELQTWFSRFVVDSVINKYGVPNPADIDLIYYTNRKSFIELLFNDLYSYTEYTYSFNLDDNKYSWPYPVKTRLMIYPTSAQFYILSESTPNNIFNLKQHDLTLLDALLQYRIDSTSVNIITDSTSTIFIDNILYVDYINLTTNLSKLIFLYLDLKINDNYSNYNNIDLISDSSSLLENQYETYVLDEFYKSIALKGV